MNCLVDARVSSCHWYYNLENWDIKSKHAKGIKDAWAQDTRRDEMM